MQTHLSKRSENGRQNQLDQDGYFDLPLSRADIADYIGLTLETVSRQMSRLKKEKIILIEGATHITFVDEQRLRDRANF